MFMYGGLIFCITYLKNTTSLIQSVIFNSNQNISVYTVNCCSNHTNIVTQYTLVFLVYIGSSTIKAFLLNVVR